MDVAEFAPIAADIQSRWWSFPIPPSALDQYVRDLHNEDASAVAAAVESLMAEGLERPPTAGAIRRRIAELEIDAPSWTDARTALARWLRDKPARIAAADAWSCPDGVCDGSGLVEEAIEHTYSILDRERGVMEPATRSEVVVRDCSCRPARTRVLRGLDALHPLLAEFIDSGHLSRRDLEHVLEDFDTQAEAQVRSRWVAFTARAIESRVLAGLPTAAALPRIEAARDDDARRGERSGELRRFDPGRLLERGAA